MGESIASGKSGDMAVPEWQAGAGLEVTVDAVAAAKRSQNRFRLIDCREEDEFAICRLEQAELMPLGQFPALAENRLRDRNEVIVVYCHHGMRSAQAASFLRDKGYRRCFSMAGGIDLWSQQVDASVPRY